MKHGDMRHEGTLDKQKRHTEYPSAQGYEAGERYVLHDHHFSEMVAARSRLAQRRKEIWTKPHRKILVESCILGWRSAARQSGHHYLAIN